MVEGAHRNEQSVESNAKDNRGATIMAGTVNGGVHVHSTPGWTLPVIVVVIPLIVVSTVFLARSAHPAQIPGVPIARAAALASAAPRPISTVAPATHIPASTANRPSPSPTPVDEPVSLLDSNWEGATFQRPSGPVDGKNYPHAMSAKLGCVRNLSISHQLSPGHPRYFEGSIGMVDPGAGQTTGLDFRFLLDGQDYPSSLDTGSSLVPTRFTIPVGSASLITIVATTEPGRQCQASVMALIDPQLTN